MIIELSSELGNVLSGNQNPFLQLGKDVAVYRIKVDIAIELSRAGMFAPDGNDIDKIYYGIPEETRSMLIASYCRQ